MMTIRPTPCVKAHWEIQKFASLVGIEINREKTDAVCTLHPELPQGSINWDVLTFLNTGRFVIDQEKVDVHIEELRFQLKEREHSIFA